MKRIALIFLMLAGCDPQVVVDKTIARTAESVISAVTGSEVANCVVDNAQPIELQVLARDVGVQAGTRTTAIIRGIFARPATQTCLTRGGLTVPTLP